MKAPEHAERQRTALLGLWRDVLIIATLAIWGLVSGAGFLIPLVLAVLAFVLVISVSDSVIAMRIGSFRPPRWFGNLVGIAIVTAGILSIMGILANQVTRLVSELPNYQGPIDAMLNRLAGFLGADLADALNGVIVDFDTSQLALTAAGRAGTFVSTFVLIFIYSSFLMAERRSIAQKITIAVADRDTGRRISHLLSTISFRLQRYVSIKTFISVITAGISYAVFKILGLDFAETWGVLTFALNFIPTIGSIVAVIFPALLALVLPSAFHLKLMVRLR